MRNHPHPGRRKLKEKAERAIKATRTPTALPGREPQTPPKRPRHTPQSTDIRYWPSVPTGALESQPAARASVSPSAKGGQRGRLSSAPLPPRAPSFQGSRQRRPSSHDSGPFPEGSGGGEARADVSELSTPRARQRSGEPGQLTGRCRGPMVSAAARGSPRPGKPGGTWTPAARQQHT